MSKHASKFDAKAIAAAARLENQIKISFMRDAGPVKFFRVHGRIIRDNVFIDFTEGGNGAKYKWMPRDEIWIDTDVDEGEVPAVMLHELHEFNRMNAGLNYDRAHGSANVVEQEARDNPARFSSLWKWEVDAVTAWAKRGQKTKP